jgi:hypothetical protein
MYLTQQTNQGEESMAVLNPLRSIKKNSFNMFFPPVCEKNPNNGHRVFVSLSGLKHALHFF